VPVVEECKAIHALRVTLRGRVQGIGVRPALARLASGLGLSGAIRNTSRGVQIIVEGAEDSLSAFLEGIGKCLPVAACVEELQVQHGEAEGRTGFSIETGGPPDVLAVRVPLDRVACHDCLAETQSTDDRRAGYAFTSCTDCGPRYSVIRTMPYERAETGMASFLLCPTCRKEYESPNNRRFHAQTTACPACGPRLWCCDRSGRVIAEARHAICAAAETIRRGHSVALRGLGGYQLIVDATSRFAVESLRRRKRRYGKPLAVMVGSLEEALGIAWLSEKEQELLTSAAGPIVVASRRDDGVLAPEISPGLATVGLMLPTTPLHALLIQECRRPLVVTSGNNEGEPLAYRPEQAIDRLHELADVWLEHDRPIERPVDDSVVRVIAGRTAMIRLARGYAPLPLRLESRRPGIALGGHQKVAVALTNGAQAVLGPHVGDLNTLASRERLLEHITALSQLFGFEPDRWVVDPHPEYFTTRWAADRLGHIASVQHHHAHVVAGMLEHGWLDREVLGVAFDGTGYGSDGTIWGGEFLRATATGFTRVAHLRPFRLPGGEKAVREPWRVAVSLVEQAAGLEAASQLRFPVDVNGSADLAGLLRMVHSKRFSPLTSSCGRLFDGVAALVLGTGASQFEGQPAMLLEAVCAQEEPGVYSLPIRAGDPKQIDWRPMILAVLHDLAAETAPGVMAMRFHRGLARAVAQLCRDYQPLPIVLSGGVFQNRVLVELIVENLADLAQRLGLPGLIPVNDGGLAAGQLAAAIASWDPRD